MKTVVFEIAEPAAAMERVKKTLRSGKPDKFAHITFRTPESMARTLTPLRWTLLEAMTGAGPVGVRELARRLGRDVKAVHTDVNAGAGGRGGAHRRRQVPVPLRQGEGAV